MGKVNQLFQDSLDDLLEAFASGAMSEADFEARLARFYPDPDEYDTALNIARDDREQRARDHGQFGVGA